MGEQCQKLVWPVGGYTDRQCSRAAWKDGYCAQHHPYRVKERREAAHKQYMAERTARRYQQTRYYAGPFIAALEEIAAGHEDPIARAKEALASLSPPPEDNNK